MNQMTPAATLSSIPDAWIKRPADQKFSDLNTLYDYTHQLADLSASTIHEAKDIEVVVDHEFKTPNALTALGLRLPDGRITNPTHHTFGQLCSLVKCPAGHYRELPAPVAAIPLQYRLNTYRGELVKSYVRKDTGELRAITSPSYGRVHDHQLVDAVRQIAGNGVGDTGWRSARALKGDKAEGGFYASDRDMFAFLVDVDRPIVVGKAPNGRDDTLYRGFFVWNSEVGSRSLGIKTFLFRDYCDNRLIFGADAVEEVVIRHTKGAPERFLEFAAPALQAYAEGSASGIQNAVEQAMTRMIARSDEDAVDFLRGKLDFSASAAKSALEQHAVEEGRPARSAWDLAQAVTAFARGIPHQNDRVTVESKVGKLLAAA